MLNEDSIITFLLKVSTDFNLKDFLNLFKEKNKY